MSGLTLVSSAANTVNDSTAKISPIRSVTQEVLGPVMKRMSEFTPQNLLLNQGHPTNVQFRLGE